MSLGEVMRRRRIELGLSQADVAAAAGVDKRQVRRYEVDEQQPVLSVAVAIAAVLRLDLSELAGASPPSTGLSGVWWSAWQTSKDGEGMVTSQEVRLDRHGDQVLIVALSRGNVTPEEGGYLWRGELRLWDNEILMGWYAVEDGAVRSKGTLYLVIHPHGRQMIGRWVGLAHDGKLVTGFAALAQTDGGARDLVGHLKTGAVVPE